MSRRPSAKRAKTRPAVDPSLTADFDISSEDAFHSNALSVDSVSVDHRRIFRQSVPLPSPSSTNPSTPVAGPSNLPSIASAPNIGTATDWDPFFLPNEADCEEAVLQNGQPMLEGSEEAPTANHLRCARSEETMSDFLPRRDALLNELIRRDGRGDYSRNDCPGCPNGGKAVIRCRTCSPGPLLCEACAVKKHADSPYHRTLRWTGQSFEVFSLKDLGLVIQLGHRHDHTWCSNPIPVPDDFCVIDVNGRHPVTLNFCGCDAAGEAGTQVQRLLRFDLYPASQFAPGTAFTFQMLEHYHVQSLQGKMSMYDYYESLERMTDNTGTRKVQNRYKEFMRVVAQWRHLKMLKRCGRGHDPSGVDGTQQGELAVRCPACPRVNINLPPNWDEVSDDLKFMYMLSVAVDACFRLKHRNVSDETKDPILGSGWGYFVEDTGYKELLAEYGDQEEICTCTGLSAIDHANTKYSKGYAATGVGAVICARHEFWLARGMADLQVGERYVNMDYVFVCAMQEYLVVNKIVSYDIACQWSKHLLERIAKFPTHAQIPVPKGSITYVIPKLHYGSHIQQGHSPYSLNYRVGAARIDGEGIEQRWWWLQPIASSTKGMGPGMRQGYVEDNLGFSNWQKVVGLAILMCSRYGTAIKAYAEQLAQFEDLTASLDPTNVAQWRATIVAWEADPFNSCCGLTETETVRVLSLEEQKVSASRGYQALHNISHVGFITMGLEIEETQARLKADAKDVTPSKVGPLFERRTVLRRKLQKYRELQHVYMPEAAHVFASDDACRTDVELVENIRIGLPSEISPSRRAVVCPAVLQDMEARIREAQCRDALHDIRNKLHTIDHLYKYKRINVRHQGPNTRVCSEITAHDVVKDRAVKRYRRARRTKLALSGPGPWENELRILNDGDICALEDDDPHSEVAKKKRKHGDKAGPAEGKRTVSWIWRSADADGNDGMIDTLRLEWLKARARTMRWREEVLLLPEEMRRVLASHRYDKQQWLAHADRRADTDPKLREGLVAYAHKQVGIRRALHTRFRTICLPVLCLHHTGPLDAEWDGDGDGLEMDSTEDLQGAQDAMYELDGEDLEPARFA
ncbi:hypothetical protein LXA43DRAFT_1093838 [Ganoderma leucocontextum]|nr:hypothetical protein LXA43DRAFT_1093838 [Ganoderma leucocontextum]